MASDQLLILKCEHQAPDDNPGDFIHIIFIFFTNWTTVNAYAKDDRRLPGSQIGPWIILEFQRFPSPQLHMRIMRRCATVWHERAHTEQVVEQGLVCQYSERAICRELTPLKRRLSTKCKLSLKSSLTISTYV